MTSFTLYHNPRCSKSRQTLALLEEKGIKPDIVLYLESPPTQAELKELLEKLDMPARDLLRSSESEYKELGLADQSLSEDKLIAAMVSKPRLIQRPILVSGSRAVLGRPPENALELI